MKIRLAAAAAAAIAAPFLLPATHALASTTHVASPSISSHVIGGCCCDGCGGGIGGFSSFHGGIGGGCGLGCGGFSGFNSFSGGIGLGHGCGGCGCGGCAHVEHFKIDVFAVPCFNPCGFGI